eukprot:gene36417-biopygen4789
MADASASAQTHIFDPGIADFDPEDTELLLDAVAAMVGSTTTRPLSFREGIFRVGKEEVKICDVLMDTGALHKSYISSELVERHRDAWKGSIIPYRSVARSADQVTKIETAEMVRGHLTFVSDNGEKEYTGLVEAIVWEMPGMDFIVGLPDIVRNYAECEVEKSPEEESTPVPVAFGPVLSFMEADYEDSRKEYFGLLDSHVGEQLSNYTDFLNLLRSDLAVDRFVPREWTGIEGFPPLDIQVKDNFPAFHKDTWTYDYVGDFERMKLALSLSVANHFPDYELDWVLRVDASDKAVGAVLFQERPETNLV